jgi:ubiquinone/menaquinone biosynthesis C-methylase UbiE
MTGHQEAIAANIAHLKAKDYESLKSVHSRSFFCAKKTVELDFSLPIKRKTLEESAQVVNDPNAPNGFNESDMPDAATFASTHPNSLFKPGIKLLDFACGTGIVTERYLPFVGESGEVVGIDINPDFLARFNERGQTATPKFVGHNYDILSESLKKTLDDKYANHFDVITCTLSYHHIDNYRDVTKRLVDFLKPGGWLVIIDFYNEDVEKTSIVSPNSAVRHMGGLKVDALVDTLQNYAGLTNATAAREFRFNGYERKEFIENHSTQETIDKFTNGELPQRDENGVTVYLVEQSIIIALGQKKQ